MRHAYLIIAHNEFPILHKLVEMLDYEENDLFIHVDKRAKDFDPMAVRAMVKYASIEFVPRRKIIWGGNSMIAVELLLLKAASKRYHDFYHLISGVDLPIKTHEEIEAFFKNNADKEFVTFDARACESGSHLERMKYYYFEGYHCPQWFADRVRNYSMRIQRIVGTDRLKHLEGVGIEIKKGSQWFDISNDTALMVLHQMRKKQYKRIFAMTSCPDEQMLQTILFNSSRYMQCVKSPRYVDWHRGGCHPETLTMNDWDKIEGSDGLFARKFSEKTDAEVIQKVYMTWGKNRI